MSTPYDDIIHLKHRVSTKHAPMPRANRAAQFAPFAALAGYDAAIHETARLTDAKIELDEDTFAALNLKLRILMEEAEAHPMVAVTHFIPDAKKKGGAYIVTTGALKKIDEIERDLVLMDGARIAIDDVLDIESTLFMGLAAY